MQSLTQLLLLALAALAAGAMGYAIQRGATCTVAAVEEVLKKGRATRLLALAEASLWVGAGLLLARHLGWLDQTPMGYALDAWTLCGAALLGLGALLNRACVFGAIARLGSGEWAYLATPLGFYLGSLCVDWLFAPGARPSAALASPLLDAPGWFAALLALALLGRAAGLLRPHRNTGASEDPQGPRWSPHAATLVIGVCFVATLLLAGAWAYTDLLADLARDMRQSIWARAVLALALLLGAMLGGWSAGLWRIRRPTLPDLLRCLSGGFLMGLGSLLIPGSNDGLILIGMPLLWPYAWAGFATMVLTIAGAMLGLGLLARRGAGKTALI